MAMTSNQWKRKLSYSTEIKIREVYYIPTTPKTVLFLYLTFSLTFSLVFQYTFCLLPYLWSIEELIFVHPKHSKIIC